MRCVRARRARAPYFVFAATLLLGGDTALAATAHVGEPVMGTVLEVTVVAPDLDVARNLAQGSIAIARHWDDVLTTWRAQGELEALNTHAGRGPLPISRDLSAALERMLALSRATHGAFDPGVGATVKALRAGTPRSGAGAVAPGSTPIGDALTLASGTATLRSGVRLDAGGIGKGIALDAVAAYLHAQGARAWFLDFGGSSQLASGEPQNADAWNVLIAGDRAGSVHGIVQLRSASLSTSRATAASDPAGAIVDPRSDAAVTTPRLATVLAADATSADAWSTALVVLGREGVKTAEAAGLQALFEDAAGTMMTEGFPLARVRNAR